MEPLVRYPESNVLRAYLALKREDFGKVRSYGVTMRNQGRDYGIISAYLPEPLGVNQAIGVASESIKKCAHPDHSYIIVKSYERALQRKKSPMPDVAYSQMNPRDKAFGACALAADAYRRKTTIEEVF
ncbi:hypothetical protein ABE137_10260 [Brevibacillus laterosporus]|uniref:hypothetical protein n=1 Tax=Brevibacillus laterosporus TaxID=1465 RepID=UPI003D2490AF